MFNSENSNGWIIGTEVVEYNGQYWMVVGEGKEYLVLENDFSYDPNYREYSEAVGMCVCVEEVMKYEVKPFCSIVMKSGTDEQWEKEYKKCGLMFEESFVNESCCE